MGINKEHLPRFKGATSRDVNRMAEDTGDWERHNAENGEHIWCGDKHIADIVTDVDNPAWDRNTSEISKSAILMHNDPKYKSAPDLYEALRDIIDPNDCSYDHHGYCQEHNWLGKGTCPNWRAKIALAKAEV